MDTFGFTQKKFTSLSPDTRHRHLARWLSGIYQKLTSNRISPAGLLLIADQYNQILGWSAMPAFEPPKPEKTRQWIELISDRIHLHRTEAGLSSLDHHLLKAVRQKDHDTEQHPEGRFNCHMALDGLRSLFNVGSIFRSCEAAGFASIILGSTPGAEHPRVQKTAMGAHEWIEQEKTEDLALTLTQKKKDGFRIVGVETIEGACAFDEYPWKEKSIIVMGNEEYGISSHVLDTCRDFVHIPMFGRKNSINVANAAAVICFQAARAMAVAKGGRKESRNT